MITGFVLNSLLLFTLHGLNVRGVKKRVPVGKKPDQKLGISHLFVYVLFYVEIMSSNTVWIKDLDKLDLTMGF